MFVLTHNGIIDCTGGTLGGFAKDLVEKICPILDYSIEAHFNYKKITVTKYDTVESIVSKWMVAPYNK